MMVRKSSSLRNAHTVNSGIPHGLEEMWHGLGHPPKRSFWKNGIRSWWTSSRISRARQQRAPCHGGHCLPEAVRQAPAVRGIHSLWEMTSCLLAPRLRRRDARFPGFWRWRGWGFGFSSNGQRGSNLCGVPLAALIGLALGGRGRRDSSSHQPICLQRRGA